MNEKSYGGNDGIRNHKGKSFSQVHNKINIKNKKKKLITDDSLDNKMEKSDLDNYIKAGDIAKQVRIFAKSIIKKDVLLVDIAKQIDEKIRELGGIPAFPVNLSIDHIAAHFHPNKEDKTLASGLLKVDFGVHINGFIADTAFSLDLTDDNKHKNLIQASQDALDNALESLKNNPTLNDIGQTIEDSIKKAGYSPITNLSGHGINQYDLHSGVHIPNYANGAESSLEQNNAYAIEPFATSGDGLVTEGDSANIYSIINMKNTRSPTARKILDYVWNEYQKLPFSLRELQEKFGNISKLAIKELKQVGIIHEYSQLIEKSRAPVSQTEHTIVKLPDKIIITTKE